MERNGKAERQGPRRPMTKPPKRHPDGDGLFFKTLGKGRAYFTDRFTLKGRETEMSLGAYPEMSLDEARVSHLRLCADALAEARTRSPSGARQPQREVPVLTSSGAPTFGHCADQHIALNEGGWKNAKHHQQWVMTLREYAAPMRELPVDQVMTAEAVLAVLTPIWNTRPETASRLRGRIEAVIGLGSGRWLDSEDRPNPARWKNWLDRSCQRRRRSGHAVITPPCPLIRSRRS